MVTQVPAMRASVLQQSFVPPFLQFVSLDVGAPPLNRNPHDESVPIIFLYDLVT